MHSGDKIAKKYGVGYQLCFYLETILQLFPVIDEGAIQGYSRMNDTTQQTPTTRMTATQLLCQRGTYIFTQIMTETVFSLDKNYRVKNMEFRNLLGWLPTGDPLKEDADILSNLHLIYYDEDFKSQEQIGKQRENHVAVCQKC